MKSIKLGHTLQFGRWILNIQRNKRIKSVGDENYGYLYETCRINAVDTASNIVLGLNSSEEGEGSNINRGSF